MSNPDSQADGILKELSVDAADAGMRLDQWLAMQLAADLSRSRIQILIRQGKVMLGTAQITEPRHKVKEGDKLRLIMPPSAPLLPLAENIALSILYEDDELIIINKPVGLVVHPGAGQPDGTLVNALMHHCGPSLASVGDPQRPGIVHRLDKDTSGALIVAKSVRAYAALTQAFADHGRSFNLERAYDALVWGMPSRMAGTIDAPLGRATGRTKRAVVSPDRSDARHAVTHFQVQEIFGGNIDTQANEPVASLVKCRLETGRTHQIRVHMAHIRHPVIGDRDYGRAFLTKAGLLAPPLEKLVQAFPRQALHARLLAFLHPVSGEPMRFEAPWPEDFTELIAGFRRWGDEKS